MTTNAPFSHRAALRHDGGWRHRLGCPGGRLRRLRRHPGRARRMLNRSGVGDVLCYHTAHFDWKLAHDSGREERRWPYDERLVGEARERLDAVLGRSRRDPRGQRPGDPDADAGPPLGRRRVPRRRLEQPPHGRRRPRLPVRARAPDRSPFHPRPGRRAWHLFRRRPPGQRAGDGPVVAPSRRAWTSAPRRWGSTGTTPRRRCGGWPGTSATRTCRTRSPMPGRSATRSSSSIRDRIHATFGAWHDDRAPTRPERRVRLMHRSKRIAPPPRIGALILSAVLIVGRMRHEHARDEPSRRRAARASTRRRPRRRGRRRHEARRDREQGHDRRRDQGRDRRRGLASSSATGRTRRTTNWSSSSRSTSRTRTARTSSSPTRARSSPSKYLDEARRGQDRRQPGAVRRDRGRGELLGRRDRPGSRRQRLPVGPDPEHDAWSSTSSSTTRRSIAFQSTAFPGDRLQQEPRASWMKTLKDLADPRLKRQGRAAAAR